jgi:hypothetical protein
MNSPAPLSFQILGHRQHAHAGHLRLQGAGDDQRRLSFSLGRADQISVVGRRRSITCA